MHMQHDFKLRKIKNIKLTLIHGTGHHSLLKLEAASARSSIYNVVITFVIENHKLRGYADVLLYYDIIILL